MIYSFDICFTNSQLTLKNIIAFNSSSFINIFDVLQSLTVTHTSTKKTISR